MMKLPPPLPHGSNHSFSNARFGRGPGVRRARAEHNYTLMRDAMLADPRIRDLVQADMMTEEDGRLTQARNIALAWEYYHALQSMIAEQRQSEAEAAPCST